MRDRLQRESRKCWIPIFTPARWSALARKHGNDTLSVWIQLLVKFLIWTKVICSEKCSLAPFCHYYKLKEDSTKKGKKKYLITIARPHIAGLEILQKSPERLCRISILQAF